MNEIINRDILGFQDAVKEYFNFIVEQYGFICISSTLYFVQYISDKVFLNVYHENISFEIYFEIGLIAEREFNLTSNDIEVLYSPEHETKCYQGSNKNNVYFVVKHIADLIEKYAKDALIGSKEFFKNALELKCKNHQHLMLLQELYVADEKAKKAWKIKDYNTVIEIYNHYLNELSPIQIAILDYSRKKVR